MSQQELLAIAQLARDLATRIERLCAPQSGGETFNEWAERWFKFRRAAGREKEQQMYDDNVRESLGKVCVATMTRDDIASWVSRMDDLVALGTIRWGTARRRWILLRAMLRDLSRSKRQELRVRSDDVVATVRGPDRGLERVGTFLYPAEFVQLVSCKTIPVERRRHYAIAVYLALRSGELEALRRGDIDLESGRIHIYRTVDRQTGKEGPTKTGCTRRFVIEPNLLELIRLLPGSAGDRVSNARRRNATRLLQRDLRTAGCTREELFTTDGQRRRLTFHDLRATGITWWAMRGDPIGDIMERVGHAQIMTTQRYMRRGRLLVGASEEELFPRLSVLFPRGKKKLRRAA
jgi:integrase